MEIIEVYAPSAYDDENIEKFYEVVEVMEFHTTESDKTTSRKHSKGGEEANQKV